ncbi:CopD family protein [Aegicerativicinus sediminis]|uniref:CopD family protein n=1 Tax=Aegicerativicinus sediminis TaxID=2893202 RepID=UPI001E4130B5|nr:CopD family protein [Aegicerativicinus sediminis]
MSEYYNYIKAIHLIFVVTWFAGLFYIPRLFVYQIEAFDKPSPDKEILGAQLKLMARRLWHIITWPSAILATVFGLWLLVIIPGWLNQGWMQIKLVFVVLLIIYHIKTHIMFKELQQDKVNYSSNFMRLWNEGATIVLFAVVFLVILKSTIGWVFGVFGLLGLMVFLILGFKLYKRLRSKNPNL